MTDRTQHRGRCQAPVVVNAAALQFLVTHHELDVREDQGRSDERIPILNSDPHLMLTRRHL